jgi:hypothetical protein
MSVRFSITCLCAVIALSGTSTGLAEQNDARPKAVVSGQVVGEDGKPVAEVVVREIGWKKDGPPATTDKEGRFAVTVEEGADGKIHTVFSANAADGRMGFVSVTQAKTEPIRLVVKAARELTVVVHDRDGKPAKNAKVQFLAEMRLLTSGVTSAEGRFACRVPADVTRWAVVARKSQLGFDYATAEHDRGSADRLILCRNG